MAATAYTIIKQTLDDKAYADPVDLDEETCKRIEHACGYAPGMDLLEMDDWQAINKAAVARDPIALKAALLAAQSRIMWQRNYKNTEHLNAVRSKFVRHPEDGWYERAREFDALKYEDHARLAAENPR